MASITKLDRQKYNLQITKTVDGTRKRKKIVFYGTRKDAEIEATRLETQMLLKMGSVQHANISFSQFAQIWFRDYGNVELKAKTSRTYKDLLNRFVLPSLGKTKLDKIRPATILSLYSKLRITTKNDKGDLLSPTTITHVHSILHKILNDAVRWQYLLDNPVDRVPKPKRNKPQPNYYNNDQIKQLIELLDDLDTYNTKWRVGCYMALMTGLRLAEIAGLMWDDIDFTNNTIHIKRIRRYVSKVGICIDTPKTDSSYRTVSMPSVLVQELLSYRDYVNVQEELCGDLWDESGYILVGEYGKELFPDSLSKWFTRFINKNELPRISIHGLRHTMATLLIHDPTVPERTISDRLGHANTNTLRKIYSHELKDTDQLAADSIDNIFKK